MTARMKIPNPAYFARKLKTFLHERHPLLEKTDEMIRIRSNKAWNVAWNALQSGENIHSALQKADKVLFEGLLFSKYDTLRCILSAEFPEIPLSEQHEYVVWLLPLCNEVFMHYDLRDDLLSSPEYNHLIFDLIEIIRRHIGGHLH